MAKKNLPNIPIYIGDWERDCNILSLESEMAWMKIIFKLHLSGKQSVYKTSTKGLQILWKSNQEKVVEILEELRFNEICEITEIAGGYEFLCRRYKKENDLSKIRSEAVNERYKDVVKPKKPKTKTTKPLQKGYKPLQNTDNEIVIENDIEVSSEIKPASVKSKKPKIDFDEIGSIFNSTCTELSQVTKITAFRINAIKKVLETNTLEDIGTVFTNVSQSDYLNGKVVSWKADFDWIFKPEIFIKILENKYKNNGKPISQRGSNSSRSNDELKKSSNDAVNEIFGVRGQS